MRLTVNSQSTINKIPSSGKQHSATMRDLLLGIDNRRDDSGIDDTRHNEELAGWLVG